MGRVLGIDLGTTNSCVAVIDNGAPLVVPCEVDRYVLPSVVAFGPDGRHLVGRVAKRQSVLNAENTIVAVKRLMGLSYNDPRAQQAMVNMPYTCCAGPSGDIRIRIADKTYAVAEVSALILAELKRAAEVHFNERLERAVIAVPAYFNDHQRQATRDAGRIAGLDVIRILNEPTAAALAYGALQHGAKRKVMVYDLGGGTFDVSVLDLDGDTIEVRATAGDPFLGGRDFDKRIVDWLKNHVATAHGIDVSPDRNAMQRLWETAEAAKIDLSDRGKTHITLPFLTQGERPVHVDCQLDRRTFESLVTDLVEKTIIFFLDTVKSAGLRPSDLDEVILVGGMTRMPIIAERVQEVLGKEPSSGVHQDLVVAVGAALQGDILAGMDDPSAPKTVLHDVTPHNLGIMSLAGLAEPIIPKDTPIPTVARKIFTTVSDGQELVRIVVFQGDNRRMEENQILGEFVLLGLRPAPRGTIQIEVSFEISLDGIVSVSAKDTETGRAQAIEIRDRHSLPENELTQMIAHHQQMLSTEGQVRPV